MNSNSFDNYTTPDILVVGHITQDITPMGCLPGGAAGYAALTALRMGYNVAVLTSTGPKLQPQDLLSEAQIADVPAHRTTTFENRYQGGNRSQIVHQRASAISFMSTPYSWRAARVLLLAPVVDEVDPEMASRFPDALVGVAPQGWLRDWDEKGMVMTHSVSPQSLNLKGHVAVLSEEEVPRKMIDGWIQAFPILAISKGAKGVDIYIKGRKFSIPAFSVPVTDSTGAGDVFTAALLLRYAETRNPLHAGWFASAAASFSVQGWGMATVPSKAQTLDRLKHLV